MRVIIAHARRAVVYGPLFHVQPDMVFMEIKVDSWVVICPNGPCTVPMMDGLIEVVTGVTVINGWPPHYCSTF